jgi:prepilin signal peptidase PulO-like enzyme (type II secretory pathway)
VRWIVLILAGASLGGLVNWAAYALAWRPRPVSPWSPAPEGAAPRTWRDRLPIVGWLRLRRESVLFGPRHWVRPLVVEVAAGAGLALLYWWEIDRLALVRSQLAPFFNAMLLDRLVVPRWVVHQELFSHVVLLALLAVASLIDIDERLTPDAVTVPGTLLGLLLAALFPFSLLPWVEVAGAPPPMSHEITLDGLEQALRAAGTHLGLGWTTAARPQPWPALFAGFPEWRSLAVSLACYGLWCFAMLPRTWYGRHGWRQAWNVFSARLARSIASWQMIVLGLLGVVLIVATWWIGDVYWAGLLTALLGLVGSGGIVWAVRLVGKAALRKEALGFGDVMLMMMAGTFIGWQAGWLVFLFAPFAALAVGLVQWLLSRDREVCYAPFLSIAALFIIVRWGDFTQPLIARFFEQGHLLLLLFVACLGLMGVMLVAWRWFATTVLGRQ